MLTVNAGSSSLKLALIDRDAAIAARELPAPRAQIDPELVRAVLTAEEFQTAEAVGHRIVHGGTQFTKAAVIDRGVEAALHELVALAPLHQPKSLSALEAVSRALPELPAVACFDTSFHATLPPAAATYALPRGWTKRWAIRRYGFHGLSHAWVARRAPELLQVPAEGLRIVSCHLGAGASLCAIRDGRSVDTTMGFTPLEGLVMATRSGTVDPGLLLWLLGRGELSAREMAEGLEHDSGLVGMTGEADMRTVLARGAAGDERAQLGLDVYTHRLRGAIAAMVASLGGLDALVFTGGVGEHSPEIRRRAVTGLAFLGADLDEEANADVVPDAHIEAATSMAAILVISAREDLEMAQQVQLALARA